jgi:hypothetical protein
MFDRKLTLKHFFRCITEWQKLYWEYEDELKKQGITASHVERIYISQTKIAEDVARFILDRNMNVEILNNKLLETK